VSSVARAPETRSSVSQDLRKRSKPASDGASPTSTSRRSPTSGGLIEAPHQDRRARVLHRENYRTLRKAGERTTTRFRRRIGARKVTVREQLFQARRLCVKSIGNCCSRSPGHFAGNRSGAVRALLGVDSHWGIEKHDDLCDACVWLILGLVGDAIEEQKVHYI
jgi:hypothetical protein